MIPRGERENVRNVNHVSRFTLHVFDSQLTLKDE